MAEHAPKTMTRARKAGLTAAGIGSLLLLVGLIGIRMSMGALGNLRVDVRPATAAEAPAPAHVHGTYVGRPGTENSVLPALRGIAIRLAALSLLAALGAGLLVWGLQVALRRADLDRARVEVSRAEEE